MKTDSPAQEILNRCSQSQRTFPIETNKEHQRLHNELPDSFSDLTYFDEVRKCQMPKVAFGKLNSTKSRYVERLVDYSQGYPTNLALYGLTSKFPSIESFNVELIKRMAPGAANLGKISLLFAILTPILVLGVLQPNLDPELPILLSVIVLTLAFAFLGAFIGVLVSGLGDFLINRLQRASTNLSKETAAIHGKEFTRTHISYLPGRFNPEDTTYLKELQKTTTVYVIWDAENSWETTEKLDDVDTDYVITAKDTNQSKQVLIVTNPVDSRYVVERVVTLI